MEDYIVNRLAEILALQAKLEGMKIANTLREYHKYPPIYSEVSFNEIEKELRIIIDEL